MGGGPCDFSVSPSPFGLDFGTLDFETSDSGLTIEVMIFKKVFNKFDANKGDSSLVTARSKYHLHVNEWEKAVLDARAVLEESSNMAQAYLSKVEGLFNLCCFEEVMMFDDKI